MDTSPDVAALIAAEEGRRALLRTYIATNLQKGTDYGTIPIGRNGAVSKPNLLKPGAEKICSLMAWRPRFSPDRATREMAGNPVNLFAYICRLIGPGGEIVGEGRGACDPAERGSMTINNAVKIAEKRAQVDAVLRAAGLSDQFTQDLEDAPDPDAEYQAHRAQTAPAQPRPVPAKPQPPPRGLGPAAEDGAITQEQQATIRRLLPAAGLTEDELVRSLKAKDLKDLTEHKAVRVIDRLTAKAQERRARNPRAVLTMAQITELQGLAAAVGFSAAEVRTYLSPFHVDAFEDLTPAEYNVVAGDLRAKKVEVEGAA